MKKNSDKDVRDILSDAHAHFFFLGGEGPTRLRLWEITSDSIVIDLPRGAHMRKTILGYIPSIDGRYIYEIEAHVSDEINQDQKPNTIRVEIDPSNIKKVDRRSLPRHNFTPPLTCKATSKDDLTPIDISIIDISAGGLRIESGTSLDPSTEYNFVFDIETEDETHSLSLKGMIVYELPTDSGRAYGIKFTRQKVKPSDEAPIEELDRTVDLIKIVNKLIVTSGLTAFCVLFLQLVYIN